ncbi:uncharacterized protein [Spinacia oleracea]|uniref:Uncharacterized protein n=1 Tax=Spinacia oleracea TaxID=3562 RepID=A0ABM3R2R0_SPIOL|nr:uncharacterized protein LOC130464394 [Spinacia oleracea]
MGLREDKNQGQGEGNERGGGERGGRKGGRLGGNRGGEGAREREDDGVVLGDGLVDVVVDGGRRSRVVLVVADSDGSRGRKRVREQGKGKREQGRGRGCVGGGERRTVVRVWRWAVVRVMREVVAAKLSDGGSGG